MQMWRAASLTRAEKGLPAGKARFICPFIAEPNAWCERLLLKRVEAQLNSGTVRSGLSPNMNLLDHGFQLPIYLVRSRWSSAELERLDSSE